MGTRSGLGFIIVGFFALLVFLLIVQSPSKEPLTESILNGIDSGNLAKMSPDSRRFLHNTIELAIEICQIDETFTLNDASNFEGLNIFTYESFIDHPLNFGAGNAVYDATVDAIFIDHNLIEPQNLIEISEEALDGASLWIRGYLLFVLCHELGHRALHTEYNAFSNITTLTEGGSFEIENAADAYAIERIHQYITRIKPDSELLSLNWETKTSIGLDINNYDGIEKLYVFLASQFMEVAYIYFGGRTTFPPNYTDSAHPPLVERLVTVLENEDVFDLISSDLKLHRMVMVEWHKRLKNTQDAIATEIHVDKPLIGASYIDENWVLISNEFYAFVDDRDLPKKSKQRQRIEVEWLPLSSVGQKFVREGIVHIFKGNDDELYITDTRNGRTALLENFEDGSHTPKISRTIRVPIQPSNWLVAYDETTISLFTDIKEKWREKSISELKVDLQNYFEIRDFEVEIGNAGQQHISLILITEKREDNNQEMLGWAHLDVKNGLTISDGELLKTPIDMKNKFAIISIDIHEVFFFLITGIDQEKLVEIYDRYGKKTAKTKIKTHEEVLMSAKSLWLDYPPVWSVDASYSPGGYLMMSYASDSVYLVDRLGNQTVVLHPQSLLRPIEDGRSVLIPFLNSYTAFIVDPARVIKH